MDTTLKICLLNVYWGELPPWFSYFLAGCSINRDVNFILFTDRESPGLQAENVSLHPFTMSDFNKLASNKLGFQVSVSFPYKICDYKPAFGKIFEDYLTDYDFWGYCDTDLVFGRIGNFLTHDILMQYDLISTYRSFLSGPFCLFRNETKFKSLYLSVHNFENSLKRDNYVGFDENISQSKYYGVSVHKILIFILFFIKSAFSRADFLFRLKELRYRFQWYYKIRMLRFNAPQDMTEVAWKHNRDGTLRLFHNELILSGEYLNRMGKSEWKFNWNHDGLFDTKSNKEIFAFHFRGSQIHSGYRIDKYIPHHTFQITQEGIILRDAK